MREHGQIFGQAPSIDRAEKLTASLFRSPEDDADRLFVSASGSRVLVTLPRAKQAVAIDLTDPEDPRPAGRTELARAGAPYVSFSPDG
ncbi:MAG: hypothetical protein ABSH35_22745, partial [Isosphaeraceae bacterium]